MKRLDPETPEQALRYWLEHELARVNASERAGFNVDKERKAIDAELTALRANCHRGRLHQRVGLAH
jgi:hypothetical protein